MATTSLPIPRSFEPDVLTRLVCQVLDAEQALMLASKSQNVDTKLASSSSSTVCVTKTPLVDSLKALASYLHENNTIVESLSGDIFSVLLTSMTRIM
jgi:hypothetical protein